MLDEVVLRSAWAQGHQLKMEGAVAFALSE
jgi:hypothetical protein